MTKRARVSFFCDISEVQTYLELLVDTDVMVRLVEQLQVVAKVATEPSQVEDKPKRRRSYKLGQRHNWTKEEDLQMLQMVKDGVERHQIAKKMNLRYSQVGSRLNKLLNGTA